MVCFGGAAPSKLSNPGRITWRRHGKETRRKEGEVETGGFKVSDCGNHCGNLHGGGDWCCYNCARFVKMREFRNEILQVRGIRLRSDYCEGNERCNGSLPAVVGGSRRAKQAKAEEGWWAGDRCSRRVLEVIG